MKKFLFSGLLLSLVFIVSGCGQVTKMDQLDNDVYHYQNQEFGFKIDLPKEFEYYQTQMLAGKNNLEQQTSDWSDLEILVPTNDLSYKKTATSYAVPVTIRIFKAGKYQDAQGFEKIYEGEELIYALKFWQKLPSDWQSRWNTKMAEEIKKSFQIVK